ncbi:hypothetical protein M8994_21730, partial [Brucella sp. 21LCYQ03]|nr:hypothetical protein [Brucella sp. 21LCYQ03]
MGWLHIPVRLKKGKNEFYVRGVLVAAELSFPEKPLSLAMEDVTLADIVKGQYNSALKIGVNVVNSSGRPTTKTIIRTTVGEKISEQEIPAIAAHSARKVLATIDASAVNELGDIPVSIALVQAGKVQDEQMLQLRSVEKNQSYRQTFISSIDGSLQYYAVNPAKGGDAQEKALFFSVHGAGVEALGQAQA